MREEMITIEKINNVEGLLAMTAFLEKMKSKSVIILFAKICETSVESKFEIRTNEKFKEMLTFIQDNWVFGSLGVQSHITNTDRILVLMSLLKIGHKS